LTDLFWEAKVTVRDYWVVKKQGDNVISVLVQTISRYQKIRAIGAISYARDQVNEGLGRAHCRVNVRDAFPKEQLEQVQNAYNRGYQLQKAGKIQAYRIYNQGGEEPVFEVRTTVDGKLTWGLAPPPPGETPTSIERLRKGTNKEQHSEDMDTAGEEAATKGVDWTAAVDAGDNCLFVTDGGVWRREQKIS
jgi:hypothetical protein